LFAAAARAAHPLVDDPPVIFNDSLAVPVFGEDLAEPLGYHRVQGTSPGLVAARVHTTVRSAYLERVLARAVAEGVGQYVLLGAGLDTFAHRQDPASRLRVFEVDRPQMQEWKRRRLARAHVPVPDTVSYVPADLTTDDLPELLSAAGLERDVPTLFGCLGFTMYLAEDDLATVLTGLAGSVRPGGAWLVADHRPSCPSPLSPQRAALAQAVEDMGEPWRNCFDEKGFAELLARCGFHALEQVNLRQAVPAQLWNRTDPLTGDGPRILTTARTAEAPPS
jgi:methyltransferase (TIGR00027 family)